MALDAPHHQTLEDRDHPYSKPIAGLMYIRKIGNRLCISFISISLQSSTRRDQQWPSYIWVNLHRHEHISVLFTSEEHEVTETWTKKNKKTTKSHFSRVAQRKGHKKSSQNIPEPGGTSFDRILNVICKRFHVAITLHHAKRTINKSKVTHLKERMQCKILSEL